MSITHSDRETAADIAYGEAKKIVSSLDERLEEGLAEVEDSLGEDIRVITLREVKKLILKNWGLK
jgi:hypothetical protein